MQAAARESLSLSTRPVHVSGGSFHPRCSSCPVIGLPWPLAADASGTYRVSLAADQDKSVLRMQELLPSPRQLVLCLCATFTIATEVLGTRQFRHAGHVSRPSLSRGSIAVKKRVETLAPPRWSQARYSSELRTDGAGSVTPFEPTRQKRARRARRIHTVTTGLRANSHNSTHLVDEEMLLRVNLL